MDVLKSWQDIWEMSRLLFSRKWHSLGIQYLLENVNSVSTYNRWAQGGGGEKGVPIAGASNLHSPATLFYTPSVMTSSYPRGAKRRLLWSSCNLYISFRMSKLPIQHFGQWHEKPDRHLSDGPMYMIGKSHKYRYIVTLIGESLDRQVSNRLKSIGFCR